MVKICFFGSRSYVFSSFSNMNKRYNFSMTFHEAHISLENVSLAKGCEVVCVFVNDYVSRDVIKQLKENGCKLIALRCAGFNNVDLAATKEYDIPVVRVPAYSPYAVAEHAFAILLTLNRKTHKAYNRIRELNFDITGLLGFDLYQKTIGIIGTGKIGQIFARIAKGFGMNVIAYDLYPNEQLASEIGFKYVELNELYKESDIVSLYCPLTDSNKYMINKDTIAKMKDGVIILNTSRGGLIKTKDLIVELKNGKIGAVGLDVYEEEEQYFFEDLSNYSGLQDDILARLLTFNNVLVTSHQAFFTEEALSNIAEVTLENVASYLQEGKLINEVI